MEENRTSTVEAGRLRFVLAPSLDSIAIGHETIAAFLSSADLCESVRNRLDVVFEEIVANIVRHGCDDGAADHVILVEIEPVDATVAVAIEDDGKAFNPLQSAPPAVADSIANVEIGGLGIPLIKSFTRALRYERVPCDRRTPPFLDGARERNRLTFEIAPGPG
jgi:anti-sigma regulatory factor (Ser/Thr protein kinase)